MWNICRLWYACEMTNLHESQLLDFSCSALDVLIVKLKYNLITSEVAEKITIKLPYAIQRSDGKVYTYMLPPGLFSYHILLLCSSSADPPQMSSVYSSFYNSLE